ncbi:hypothetical protein BCR43DRAFT_449887 [Syncephalastrum racemosum]|uniref:G-protein coupled receptors family 1 profile domain-containing protein n=1 Tax=Syncephalastrum racemosum TaxID=13706 RepID=A0A1X2HTJ0_SYNRA|nr:hypothetical protein BCR43DRAFT_449887 [Syncephalastrum racemosum]
MDLSYANPDAVEIMTEGICLVCLTVLAAAMGAKTSGERLKTITFARTLVIIVYFFSWAFAAITIVVLSTNYNNPVSCTAGITSCDVFYAGSKVIMYCWLIERVHLVTTVRVARRHSKMYIFNMCLIVPYVFVFVLMLRFRINYITETGECINGLERYASIPLLSYDFLLNSYLTFLFVRPLLRSAYGSSASQDGWNRNSRLKRLAQRTLFASVVCLIVSFVNILVLVILNGQERGVMCLTMCCVDVTINVVTVHWVTSASRRSLAAPKGPVLSSSGRGSQHSSSDKHHRMPPTSSVVEHEGVFTRTVHCSFEQQAFEGHYAFYPRDTKTVSESACSKRDSHASLTSEDDSVKSTQASQSSVQPLH